jgi:hypothetical protein
MTPHILLISLLLLPHVCRETRSQNAEVEASAGFRVEKVLGYKGIQGFTWDDHGRVWMLSSSQNRLIVSTVPAAKPGEIQPLRSFQGLGNGRSSLLAAGNTVFVSDGEAIRSFAANATMSDGTLHVPPASLFPAHLEISSLAWSPLGYIYFLYHSSVLRKHGIGRVNFRGTQWDVVAKGTFTNLGFDLNGFVIAADEESTAPYERTIYNLFHKFLTTCSVTA